MFDFLEGVVRLYPVVFFTFTFIPFGLLIFNSVMNQIHLYHVLINLVEKDKDFEWSHSIFFTKIKVRRKDKGGGQNTSGPE
jgi:hypothetical protein